MATLKVNLSSVGNACTQDSTQAGKFPEPGWYVFLNKCDNKPFINAGKEYGPFPVDHGYVEIKDVPPGRYILFAIVNPFPVSHPIPGGEMIFQSNFASHFAVVEVCCGCRDICVTLYNSGWHYCVQVIIYWMQMLAMHEQIEPEVAKNAVEALTAALKTGRTLPADAMVNRQIGRLVEIFKSEKS